MPSTEVKETVQTFNSLDVNDRLAVLGMLYSSVSNSVKPDDIQALSSPEVTDLVNQAKKLPEQKQLQMIRALFLDESEDTDQVQLDPHPSAALGDLLTGGDTFPTKKYSSLKTEAKLAFWYQLAQATGGKINSILADNQPSSEVQSLATSLKSLDAEQQAAFLSKVL